MADRAELPKYQQLAELLIREIGAGRLRLGDRLPPERQMAEEMGVAVGTLRKALLRLREQGVVEPLHGSGNYVRSSDKAGAIYALFRLERVDGGGLPRARVLSVDKLPKPDDLPHFGVATTAHRIRRLRLLDDTVVAAEEIWLDAHWAEEISPAQLSESLYLYYREKLGLWIAGTEDRVGTGQMPEWGEATGVGSGKMCGHILRISQTQDGALPEVSQTWFNPERARFVARSGSQG